MKRITQWIAQTAKVNPSLIVWFSILIAIILISAIGPIFLPSPIAQDISIRLQGPSAAHPFGTDDYGRDTFSRVVSAGRVSLAVGAAVTLLATGIGTVIGLIAGYYGRLSSVLMRLMDALMSFPALVLAIALVVALSTRFGAFALILALVVVFVPHVARVVRSRTVALASRGFITAARVSGVPAHRVLFVHILPNAVPAILVQTTLIYASALLADASLSFLGLGIAPPTPTWGNMIAEARPYIASTPLTCIVPGVAIVIAVLSFNLAGDSLRVMVDPRARRIASLNSIDAMRRRRRRDRMASTTAVIPVKHPL